MKKITLDFEGIQSKEDLHEMLARELELPDYYGKTLDALYDCLTDITDDTLLTLTGIDYLEHALGRYTSIFLRVLDDASFENSSLDVDYE